MKVRFTPDVFRFQRFGGVSRYFLELHRGLRVSGVDSSIVAGLHINDLVGGEPGVAGVDVGGWPGGRARQGVTKVVDAAVNEALVHRLGPGDLLHASWYPPRVPRRSAGPILVTTVFDMIPERFPDLVPRAVITSERKRRWCEEAAHVFAISDDTKSDLVDRFGLDPGKITVTHLGVRSVAPGGARPEQHLGPYVVYVGDRNAGYKNAARLVEALTLPAVPAELRLICFGGGPATEAELDLLRRFGLRDRVSFVSGDDACLAACLAGAEMLVYPSLYEGFGLPILEAMQQRCPVVTARVGAIPEVAADAALYADPYDVESIADAIAQVLTDDARRRGLVERGVRRADGFRWDTTVQSTLERYRSLVGGTRDGG